MVVRTLSLKTYSALAITVLVLHQLTFAEVNVYVEPQVIRKGQMFQLMVEARGEQVGEPQLPNIEGLTISSTPNISEDRWSLGAFGREHVKIRGFRAWSKDAGTFRIPPVYVEIDGQKESSKPLEITVRDAADTSTETTEVTDRASKPAASTSNRQISLDNVLLAKSEISKTTVYLQEPILLKLKRFEVIYPRVQVRVFDETEPITEGFYVISTDSQTSAGFGSVENVDGLDYRVSARHRVLYPTMPGTLTIGAWQTRGILPVRERYRFYDREIVATAEPVVIEVKSLPPPPQSFTGAVGKFQVDTNWDKQETVPGVPVTLTITVTGDGNPNAVGQPRLPAVENLTISQPDVKVVALSQFDKPEFQKTFRYSITPIAAGHISVPSFEFSFFDPEKEQYVSQQLGPFLVVCRENTSSDKRFADFSGANTNVHKRVEVIEPDLEPIITDVEQLTPAQNRSYAVIMVISLPPILWFGLATYMTRKRIFDKNPEWKRFRTARNKALRQLQEASNKPDPVAEIYQVIRNYLAEKGNLPALSLTTADASRILEEFEVDRAVSENVIKILKKCERTRYASVEISDEEVRALIDGTADVIKNMEKHFRKTKKP